MRFQFIHTYVSTSNLSRKDVILPFELQKAMAAEAEGTRLAKAKIIEAEGEIKAAENLKQASRIMMENPQVMLVSIITCKYYHMKIFGTLKN